MEGCKAGFAINSQDWQQGKLAAFRFSTEYTVFRIGGYVSTHLLNQKFRIRAQNPHAMKTHRTANLLH